MKITIEVDDVSCAYEVAEVLHREAKRIRSIYPGTYKLLNDVADQIANVYLDRYDC